MSRLEELADAADGAALRSDPRESQRKTTSTLSWNPRTQALRSCVQALPHPRINKKKMPLLDQGGLELTKPFLYSRAVLQDG